MTWIASFNCHSFRNNMNVVKDLLLNNDIVLLQKLMMYEYDIGLIEQLDPNFICNIVVQDKLDRGIIRGRPSRGVAILYHKKLVPFIENIKVNDRINGIILNHDNQSTLLLNVYMPYDAQTVDSLDNYRNYLAILNNIIEESNINNVIIAGDLNADSKKGRFWSELDYFINMLNLFHVTADLPKIHLHTLVLQTTLLVI